MLRPSAAGKSSTRPLCASPLSSTAKRKSQGRKRRAASDSAETPRPILPRKTPGPSPALTSSRIASSSGAASSGYMLRSSTAMLRAASGPSATVPSGTGEAASCSSRFKICRSTEASSLCLARTSPSWSSSMRCISGRLRLLINDAISGSGRPSWRR